MSVQFLESKHLLFQSSFSLYIRTIIKSITVINKQTTFFYRRLDMWNLVDSCGKCLPGRMSQRYKDNCRTGLRAVGYVNRSLTSPLSHPATVLNRTALLPNTETHIKELFRQDVHYTVSSLLFSMSHIVTFMFQHCWFSITLTAQRLHKNSANMENIKNYLNIIFL